MRVALFVIILFLGGLISEFNIMSKFSATILAIIGLMSLAFDYTRSDKWNK